MVRDYGIYLQDEWSLTPTLPLNYGARFDAVRAYTREQQLSPRVNMVWKPAQGTTLHLGYLLRDGSGVGVGAPQYGVRRGFFVGIHKAF